MLDDPNIKADRRNTHRLNFGGWTDPGRSETSLGASAQARPGGCGNVEFCLDRGMNYDDERKIEIWDAAKS